MYSKILSLLFSVSWSCARNVDTKLPFERGSLKKSDHFTVLTVISNSRLAKLALYQVHCHFFDTRRYFYNESSEWCGQLSG